MTGDRASNPPGSDDVRYEIANLDIATATDVGRLRSANQDAFGEFEDDGGGWQVLFVADGMGGHRGGEVASQLAVDCVGEHFSNTEAAPAERLRGALELANARIHGKSQAQSELSGMGTTGVGLVLTGESVGWIAHVGDSRAYRLRDGALEQLTSDHSVVGELVRRGQLTPDEARAHPQSNEILRALGTHPEVEVELRSVDVEPGDQFLLCSDGLWGELSDPEIADVLRSSPPGEAAPRLVELANEAGGADNITLQIAAVPDWRPRSAKSGAERAAAGGNVTEAIARDEHAERPGASRWVRWALVIVLLAALALVLFGGPASDG
jgi:protein phosphatase